MTQLPPSMSRIVAAVVIALAAISVAACDGSRSSPTAVTPPNPNPTPPGPTPPPNIPGAFYGDSVIVSVSGRSPCGSGEQVGDGSAGARWDEVVIENSTFLIAYDFEWVNGYDSPRYEGTLNGLKFVDDYRHPLYPATSCQFRESSISGSFSADLLSFEMRETYVYGPRGKNEYRVVTLHRAALR